MKKLILMMLALLGGVAIEASMSSEYPYRITEYENGQIVSNYMDRITVTIPGIGIRTYQKDEDNTWPILDLVPSHVKIIGNFTPVYIQPRRVQQVHESNQRDISFEQPMPMSYQESKTCEQLILEDYTSDYAFATGSDRDTLDNKYRNYLENMARQKELYSGSCK